MVFKNFKHSTFFFLCTESLTKEEAEESPNPQYSFYTLSLVVLISNIIIAVVVILKYHEHRAGHGYQKLQSSY